MTHRALLLDLAARCEAASDSDWKLDAEIMGAVTGTGDVVWGGPSYTGSLDAALTLVPEGYALDMFSDDEGCSAMVGSPASGKAATLPLALTAAALKALAAQIGEGE